MFSSRRKKGGPGKGHDFMSVDRLQQQQQQQQPHQARGNERRPAAVAAAPPRRVSFSGEGSDDLARTTFPKEEKDDSRAKAKPREDGRPTIALNMICKDEAHCIEESLRSALPHVDAWVIVDTGSTDGTQDVVRRFFSEAGLPGFLVERPWVSFGANRTEALRLCEGVADYAWVLDADDLVAGEPVWPEQGQEDSASSWHDRLDGFDVKMEEGELLHTRVQIFRVASRWKYVGVLHEYPACEAPLDPQRGPATELLGGKDARVIGRRLGSRNKDQKRKFERDVEVLTRALQDDPDNERYWFYLGESLKNAGRFEEALRAYRRRVEMGRWIEEVYVSRLREHECLEAMGAPWEEQREVLERAIACHPRRAEAIYRLARRLRVDHGDCAAAFEVGRHGIGLTWSADFLFAEGGIYDWKLADEVATSASWCGHADVTLRLCEELLAEGGKLPANETERVRGNLDIARSQVGDAESGGSSSSSGARSALPRFRRLAVFHAGYASIYDGDARYGSELALHELASGLCDSGDGEDWAVVIFSDNCHRPRDDVREDGRIRYRHGREFAEFQRDNEIDLLVVSRYVYLFLEHVPRARKTVLWLHDTTPQPFWDGKALPHQGAVLTAHLLRAGVVDVAVALTRWHKNNLLRVCPGLDPRRVVVIPDGIVVSSDAAAETTATKAKRERELSVWCSSPDRGVGVALDAVTELGGDARIDVYRDPEFFSKALLERMNECPSSTYHGRVEHARVQEAFAGADVFLYPTWWEETCCMSALEAQANGCIPVTTDLAALEETVGPGGELVRWRPGTTNDGKPAFFRDFVRAAQKVLREESEEKREARREASRAFASLFAWPRIVDEWLRMVGDVQFHRPVPALPLPPMVAINLDRRPDRWNRLCRRAHEAGLYDPERFPAVDGRTLTEWTPELRAIFGDCPPRDMCQPGVIGAALSHVSVWRQIVDRAERDMAVHGDRRALESVHVVLEDDVRFCHPDFLQRWDRVWERARDDTRWGVLLLGCTDDSDDYSDAPVFPDAPYQVLNPGPWRRRGGGAFAYAIRGWAAKRYLRALEEENGKMRRAVDWFMFDHFRSLVQGYKCVPHLIASDVASEDMLGSADESDVQLFGSACDAGASAIQSVLFSSAAAVAPENQQEQRHAAQTKPKTE